MFEQGKKRLGNIEFVQVFSKAFTVNKFNQRSVLVNIFEVACILIYASFTMNSAMVWVELNTLVGGKEY